MQALIHWTIFLAAACLEVAGDAVIRTGLRGAGLAVVLLGGVMLAIYGVVVNQAEMDFSRLLGTYVAVFALVSVLVGKLYFGDAVSLTTWIGMGIIIAGGLVIQFGPLLQNTGWTSEMP